MVDNWKSVGLAIASSLITFALLEGAVRLVMSPPYRVTTPRPVPLIGHIPDPELGWALPDKTLRRHHRFVSRDKVDFDVWYSFRNGERISADREPTGPDVIVTGCSFTFGHGLNDSDAWPWLLQHQLADYHFHNVACMGYGTDQALLAAGRRVFGGGSQADVRGVVLGFADFQIERNRSSQGWMRVVYPFDKPLLRLRDGSLESRGLVRFWTPGPLLSHSFVLDHLCNTLANRWYRIPSHEEARELTIRLIIDYAERFRRKGIAFVVVMFPYHEDFTARSMADRQVVTDRLRAANVKVVAIALPRLPNGRLDIDQYMVSRVDVHPNRRYTTIVADQLAPVLKASLSKSPGKEITRLVMR